MNEAHASPEQQPVLPDDADTPVSGGAAGSWIDRQPGFKRASSATGPTSGATDGAATSAGVGASGSGSGSGLGSGGSGDADSAGTGRRGLSRIWAAALASAAIVWPAVAGRRWGPQRLVPGVWYRLLKKPVFQPPDAAIPVAWTLIDGALAASAYRLLRKPGSASRNRALGILAVNVGLIGAWSGVFFGRRNLPASTAVAAAMVGTGAAFVAQARSVDRPAAAAGVPFVAWVGFATLLTAALWRRNR